MRVFALLILIALLAGFAQAGENPRVIIMTDHGKIKADGSQWIGDTDDLQSMCRLLLYSNKLDLEGLICVTANSVKYALYPEGIHERIDAYAKVRPNLLLHEKGFPEPEYLHRLVKLGNVDPNKYGLEATGPGKSSEGSRWIIAVVDQPDPRPVYICAWGGTNTLAQALTDVRRERSPEQLAAFVRKIRLIPVHRQDSSTDWIPEQFPTLKVIEILWNWNGMSVGPSDHKIHPYYFRAKGGDESLVSHDWVRQNIRGRGPLSDLYPFHYHIMEGDTPSFLYLLPNDLGDPEKPELGSWGGRYTAAGPVHKEVDETVEGITETYASVWRWRPAYQNDFAARMDWCVKPYAQANHNPVAAIKGEARRTVKPGATVSLSAEGSTDPDGNELTYNWSFYPPAPVEVKIDNPNKIKASFVAPQLTKPETFHVLLTAKDNGTPNLYSYKRIELRIVP